MATIYVWDPTEDNVIREKDEHGNTLANYTTRPTLHGAVLSQDRGGQVRHYHYDGQGNTVSLTDDAGNVTDTRKYSAFGVVTENTGTTEFAFIFGGQFGWLTDSLTGHVQIKSVQFQPTLGRLLSAQRNSSYDSQTRSSDHANGPRIDYGCIARCEDVCAIQYPHFWQYPQYVGCVYGCRPGCQNKPVDFWDYICWSFDQYDDCAHDALHCVCGIVGYVEPLLHLAKRLPPQVQAAILLLDCLCNGYTVVKNYCDTRETVQLPPLAVGGFTKCVWNYVLGHPHDLVDIIANVIGRLTIEEFLNQYLCHMGGHHPIPTCVHAIEEAPECLEKALNGLTRLLS